MQAPLCFICGGRTGNRTAITNMRTGRGFCRKCNEMPGFWRMFWDSRSEVKPAVDDPLGKEPENLAK